MTEKKVKRHLQRIWFHYVRLENALNAAHNEEVIAYDGYPGVAPCECMVELKIRITKTTTDALVNSVNRELRENVRGY